MVHLTVIVNVTLAPTARLAVEQVTVPDANVQPEEADTNVAPDGSVSVTFTFVASRGPLFFAVKVYVEVAPEVALAVPLPDSDRAVP